MKLNDSLISKLLTERAELTHKGYYLKGGSIQKWAVNKMGRPYHENVEPEGESIASLYIGPDYVGMHYWWMGVESFFFPKVVDICQQLDKMDESTRIEIYSTEETWKGTLGEWMEKRMETPNTDSDVRNIIRQRLGVPESRKHK
jgi:hypothetical protein